MSECASECLQTVDFVAATVLVYLSITKMSQLCNALCAYKQCNLTCSYAIPYNHQFAALPGSVEQKMGCTALHCIVVDRCIH